LLALLRSTAVSDPGPTAVSGRQKRPSKQLHFANAVAGGDKIGWADRLHRADQLGIGKPSARHLSSGWPDRRQRCQQQGQNKQQRSMEHSVLHHR
jgi:hypothetical protein